MKPTEFVISKETIIGGCTVIGGVEVIGGIEESITSGIDDRPMI